MPVQIYSFAVGLAAFLIYVIVFLVFMRLRLRLGWVTLQVVAAAGVHVICSVLSFFWVKDFHYWHALGIFAVAWFCFFTLSTAIYVSISARILRTLNRQPGRQICKENVYQQCIRAPFFQRAEFLVATRLAEKGKIGYKLTRLGSRNAGRVLFLRRLFGMEGSGFYTSPAGLKTNARMRE